MGSILGYSAFSSGALGAEGVGVGVGLVLMLLLIGVAADRIDRRRLGRMRPTDEEISLHRLDGSTVTLRWEEVRSMAEFTRWSPWGEAGGGHPGVRLVSDRQEILIHANIVSA